MLSGGLRTKANIKQSQENMPFITVITVVRNGEKTLEETILSVINQTYKNIEYIIIDGASNDGTLDIIKKYEDKIDCWISEPDEGIYYAMNKSLGLASGDFVNFMNAGDLFFETTVIDKFVEKIDDKNAIYYGDAYMCDKRKIYNGRFNAFKLTLDSICHQTIFYPKIIYRAYKYPTKYILYADHVYNLTIFRKMLFKYLDNTIAIYRGGGISTVYIDEEYNRDKPYLIYKNLGMAAFLYWMMYQSLVAIHRLLGRPLTKLRKIKSLKCLISFL